MVSVKSQRCEHYGYHHSDSCRPVQCLFTLRTVRAHRHLRPSCAARRFVSSQEVLCVCNVSRVLILALYCQYRYIGDRAASYLTLNEDGASVPKHVAVFKTYVQFVNVLNTFQNFKKPTNALYYQVLFNVPYICFGFS